MNTKEENLKLIKESGWEVKNVKTFRGMEGDGFNSTLYYKNKRVGTADNDGNGGQTRIYFNIAAVRTDPGLEKRLKDFGDSLTEAWPEEFGDTLTHHTYNADGVIDALISEFLDNKGWKSKCKKGVVYLLKSNPGMYWVYPEPYSPPAAEALRKKFGENLIEIVNERFI